MTNQEIEQVKQLSEKGYSWTEIAKLMNKTISAIHWIRRTQNLKSKNKKISQSQIDEILQLVKDGHSLKYIIKKNRITQKYYWKICSWRKFKIYIKTEL